MTGPRLQPVAEIESAATPDLTRIPHQVGLLVPDADRSLVSDIHLGRTAISSTAAVREAASVGVEVMACLTNRDRNVATGSK